MRCVTSQYVSKASDVLMTLRTLICRSIKIHEYNGANSMLKKAYKIHTIRAISISLNVGVW